MRRIMRQAATAVGVVMAAGALQLAATAPASASPNACESYLKWNGYNVGPKVKQACKAAANDWLENANVLGGPCHLALMTLGIPQDRAIYACQDH